MSRWPHTPRVELITTDGFLHSNAELERRGLLQRKGFPESYDRRALMRFVAAVKSGMPVVEAPQYSHLTYDMLPDTDPGAPPRRAHRRGAQRAAAARGAPRRVEHRGDLGLLRLLGLRRRTGRGDPHLVRRALPPAAARPPSPTRSRTSTATPGSSDDEARATASAIWEQINEPEPGRERAADPRPRHAGAHQGRRPRGRPASGCARSEPRAARGTRRRGRSVPVRRTGVPLAEGVARRAVRELDVVQAPLDLGDRVGAPVARRRSPSCCPAATAGCRRRPRRSSRPGSSSRSRRSTGARGSPTGTALKP